MPVVLEREGEMLVEIDPKLRANVDRLIAKVGETEFRRGVAQMTHWDLRDMTLDDVACLYVLARQGRVGPPEAGPRAAALHSTLPGRTDDDAGFSDPEGRTIIREEWLHCRADRLADHVSK
jgi:hypothetical protein